MKYVFKCTLHNILFGVGEGCESYLAVCPLCWKAERGKLVEEADTLRAHRDALVKAFEIKQLLTPST